MADSLNEMCWGPCRKPICGCRVWPCGGLRLVGFSRLPGMTECSGVARRAVGRVSTCCRGCRFTWGLTMARSPSSARRRTVARSLPLLETWRTTDGFTQVRAGPTCVLSFNFPWCRFEESAAALPPFPCCNCHILFRVTLRSLIACSRLHLLF